MEIFNCQCCGKQFLHRIQNDRVIKYCSRECSGIARRGKPSWNKGISATWAIGNKFAKGNIPANKGKKCPQNSGRKNPRWKGGKYVGKDGYVHIKVGDRKYRGEHVLIVESIIGRKLQKPEVVHHINGVRSDNRPENLYLFPNVASHLKSHRLNEKLQSNLHGYPRSTS